MEDRPVKDMIGHSEMIRAIPMPIAWNPDLSIYASASFLASVSDSCGWIGGVDETGKTRCILPYTVVRKASVKMARFRVETIPLERTLELAQEQAFLAAAVQYLRSIGVHLIIPAATNAIFRTYPKGAIAAPYGTLFVDLTESEEKLWKNLHSKHRNVIRNAQRQSVLIRSGREYADIAYKLIRDTFRRSYMRYMSRVSFDRMLAGLGEYVKVMVAEHNGIVQGCAVIPFSRACAYYSYGGTDPQRPLTGALNLLQWEAMLELKRLGVKRYDFCGIRINPEPQSKQGGLYMFKERFGARLMQGYMWKQYLRPLGSFAYRAGIRLSRRGDIVDQERKRLGLREAPADLPVTGSRVHAQPGD